jgi:hypothetical protein
MKNHALQFDRINFGMGRLVYISISDHAEIEPETSDDGRPAGRQIVFSLYAVVEIDVLDTDAGVEVIVGNAAEPNTAAPFAVWLIPRKI